MRHRVAGRGQVTEIYILFYFPCYRQGSALLGRMQGLALTTVPVNTHGLSPDFKWPLVPILVTFPPALPAVKCRAESRVHTDRLWALS
jgi:hypothetical protein